MRTSLSPNAPGLRLAKLSSPTQSSSRSIGKYSAACTPNCSLIVRSNSGRSIADQSGR